MRFPVAQSKKRDRPRAFTGTGLASRFAPVAVPPVIRAELLVDFFSEIDGLTRLFNLHDKF